MTSLDLEDEVQLYNTFLTSHLTNFGKKGFYKHQFISQSEAETNKLMALQKATANITQFIYEKLRETSVKIIDSS